MNARYLQIKWCPLDENYQIYKTKKRLDNLFIESVIIDTQCGSEPEIEEIQLSIDRFQFFMQIFWCICNEGRERVG